MVFLVGQPYRDIKCVWDSEEQRKGVKGRCHWKITEDGWFRWHKIGGHYRAANDCFLGLIAATTTTKNQVQVVVKTFHNYCVCGCSLSPIFRVDRRILLLNYLEIPSDGGYITVRLGLMKAT
ncbi:hypothetical protein GmHk_20G056736 [Glycine max]|nr:hypothetical protein GmHk_20G056736 [Glycine max]